MIASVLLAAETPLDDPDSTQIYVLYNIDIVMTCIFFIEVLMKIIAFGFLFNGRASYMRLGWNIMDILIVIISIVSLFGSESLKVFKVLRLFRVLRPLRVISRNEGLKLAVQTIIMAIPNLFNLLIVQLVFYLLFGIFCVSFLKGSFHYCYVDHIPGVHSNDILTKFDCLSNGGVWLNNPKNFDNTLNAIRNLFEISTASWVKTGQDAVDMRGIEINS